jgi:hypothetical protein
MQLLLLTAGTIHLLTARAKPVLTCLTRFLWIYNVNLEAATWHPGVTCKPNHIKTTGTHMHTKSRSNKYHQSLHVRSCGY